MSRSLNPAQARTDVVGSLLRPPDSSRQGRVTNTVSSQCRNSRAPRMPPSTRRSSCRRSRASTSSPTARLRRLSFQSRNSPSRRRGLRRVGHRRVPVGHVAERRSVGARSSARPSRSSDAAPRRFRRRPRSSSTRAPAHRPDREGHAPQPEPLRQLLGSATFDATPYPGRGLPARRRRDPPRRGRRAGASGRHVHPARRAALSTARRPRLP